MRNGLAELLALVGVGEGVVEAGLHEAEGAGGEDEALEVEALHEDADAFVDLAEDVFFGDEDVVEGEFARVGAAHAEFVELLDAGEALCGGVDDEGGYAFAGAVGNGLGVDDDGVSVRALKFALVVRIRGIVFGLVRGTTGEGKPYVCDPHLGAVEQVATVDLLCSHLHGNNVAASSVLGHSKSANTLTGDQARQVLGLLLLVAVEHQLVYAELRVCCI